MEFTRSSCMVHMWACMSVWMSLMQKYEDVLQTAALATNLNIKLVNKSIHVYIYQIHKFLVHTYCRPILTIHFRLTSYISVQIPKGSYFFLRNLTLAMKWRVIVISYLYAREYGENVTRWHKPFETTVTTAKRWQLTHEMSTDVLKKAATSVVLNILTSRPSQFHGYLRLGYIILTSRILQDFMDTCFWELCC